MRRKTIYISGKLDERPFTMDVRLRFEQVAAKLRSEGWHVLDPANSGIDVLAESRVRWAKKHLKGHKPDVYTEMMALRIVYLAGSDAIYMLPDFMDSKGSKAEHAFAIACGMKVYYDDELFETGILRGCEGKYLWTVKVGEDEK